MARDIYRGTGRMRTARTTRQLEPFGTIRGHIHRIEIVYTGAKKRQRWPRGWGITKKITPTRNQNREGINTRQLRKGIQRLGETNRPDVQCTRSANKVIETPVDIVSHVVEMQQDQHQCAKDSSSPKRRCEKGNWKNDRSTNMAQKLTSPASLSMTLSSQY